MEIQCRALHLLRSRLAPTFRALSKRTCLASRVPARLSTSTRAASPQSVASQPSQTLARSSFQGSVAWWLWGLVHVGFLTGARNRVTVVVNWAWNFFAQHSGVRLITEKQV